MVMTELAYGCRSSKYLSLPIQVGTCGTRALGCPLTPSRLLVPTFHFLRVPPIEGGPTTRGCRLRNDIKVPRNTYGCIGPLRSGWSISGSYFQKTCLPSWSAEKKSGLTP